MSEKFFKLTKVAGNSIKFEKVVTFEIMAAKSVVFQKNQWENH